MLEKKDNQKTFSRRAFLIGGMQGMVLGVLGGRLAWLQIIEGQKYKTLSDRNRIDLKMLAPSRGEIIDRNGIPLAQNKQNFRVLIIPEQADNIRAALRRLQSLISLEEAQINKVLEDAGKSAKFIPVEIKDNLAWDDVATIEVHMPDLPGITIDVGEQRHYPLGLATAHIVGYVGSVSPTEIKEAKILSLPGFKTGKTGIEKKYEQTLRGKAGSAQVEVNVVGRNVRELDRTDAQNGQKLVLSIDSAFQTFTQNKLNEHKSASAVVMDSHTGAVYALASSPSFNPNTFVRGWTAEDFEELLAHPGKPLNNKAVTGLYPPGSTFKMVTALAGLEHNIITKNSTAYCSGVYEYGSDRFHCWKRSGHGRVDLVEALMKSCDVFFYDLATQIGIDEIAATARRLGLGQKYNFDLREEKSGLVPTTQWKRGQGSEWRTGQTIITSIGQGSLQTTPLQLAVMTARLVNGGYAVKPWLVANTAAARRQNTSPSWPNLPFQQTHLDLIRKGMDSVVNNRHGTAHGSMIDEPGRAMGGKTGTAQVRRITMEQRQAGVKNEDLPWKDRHHALFVGYAPLENPRYVCSVVVEHGISGSGAAAPLAKDLLLEVQRLDPAARHIDISALDHITENG